MEVPGAAETGAAGGSIRPQDAVWARIHHVRFAGRAAPGRGHPLPEAERPYPTTSLPNPGMQVERLPTPPGKLSPLLAVGDRTGRDHHH